MPSSSNPIFSSDIYLVLGKKVFLVLFGTGKKPPTDPKPNPIPNLTLPLPLIPHRGLFSGGVFPDTIYFFFKTYLHSQT